MILLTVRQKKNMFSMVVSSEPGIFWGSEKSSMKHLGFSPFIKEQWIGEKRIPNSNLIYRIVWNFLLWNHLILHVLVACISTLASGWSFPQILFNFSLLDTCMTMDSRGLRVMLNDTHLKHRGLFGRAGDNHRRRIESEPFVRTWVIKL